MWNDATGATTACGRLLPERARDWCTDCCCPVKGFLEPMLPEEPTDDIHPDLR